jgi:uridine kinase
LKKGEKMPLIIGIAGGSGSGKTTIAKNIKSAFSKDERVVIIEMDSYYRDFSDLSLSQRELINYDSPDATEKVEPADIIILEGIMTFYKKEIRNLLDIKIFVDTDADIRVLRRIKRDMEQRGRSFDEIRERYYTMVRPAYRDFVRPTIQYSDIVIPEGGANHVAIDMITCKIHHWLDDKKE